MRVIFPDKINKERAELAPYLEYSEGHGFVLKKTAPQEIKQRYVALQKDIADFKNKCR